MSESAFQKIKIGLEQAIDMSVDLRRYGWAPGNYMVPCHKCGGRGLETFGDKRAITCYPCARKMHDDRVEREKVVHENPWGDPNV